MWYKTLTKNSWEVCKQCGKRFFIDLNEGTGIKYCSKECSKKARKDAQYKATNTWHKRNRKRLSDYQKRRKKMQRIKALKLIGNKCIVCNTTKNILFHEVYGKLHTVTYDYILKNYKDFVSMCKYHHQTLHTFAKNREKYLELENMFAD